jgi:serine/threonine-protein kinase
MGRYTLVRRLAVGGMAELYLAHQRGAAGFAKLVALKRILPHLAENPTFTRMFLDEARLAAGLDHPNLAHVLDFGEDRGEHFLTMEYVHGRNLLQLLRAANGAALPLSTALTIIRDVARGLHDLHEQHDPRGRPMGLVHRDVSPSNVLVSFDGKVKLSDFGLAKAMELTTGTRSGAFKGKLGHSSPEQARGEEMDRRSDVFCLGILVYEVTTGALAFSGPNEFAVLGKVARGVYVPPGEIVAGYPEALAAIVDKALCLNVDRRYATALEVAEAVERFARRVDARLAPEVVATTMSTFFGPAPPIVVPEELELATAAAAPEVPPPAPRRSPAVWFAVPLAVVAGAAGAWMFTRGGTPTDAPLTRPPGSALVVPTVVPVPVPTETAEEAEDPPAPVAAPPPTLEPAPLEAAAQEPSSRTKATKRRKRRKRRKPAGGGSRPEGLYPPGS